MTTCNLRKRKDDIPKLSKKEHTWHCEECGALIMSTVKPKCRRVVHAEMDALRTFADMDVQHKAES